MGCVSQTVLGAIFRAALYRVPKPQDKPVLARTATRLRRLDARTMPTGIPSPPVLSTIYVMLKPARCLPSHCKLQTTTRRPSCPPAPASQTAARVSRFQLPVSSVRSPLLTSHVSHLTSSHPCPSVFIRGSFPPVRTSALCLLPSALSEPSMFIRG
jgi:hypothetical protein